VIGRLPPHHSDKVESPFPPLRSIFITIKHHIYIVYRGSYVLKRNLLKGYVLQTIQINRNRAVKGGNPLQLIKYALSVWIKTSVQGMIVFDHPFDRDFNYLGKFSICALSEPYRTLLSLVGDFLAI